MTSLGRSFKTPYLPAAMRRPGMPRRTVSGSSEISSAASSPRSEDQFALSVCNTPTAEDPPHPPASVGPSASTATISAPATNTSTAARTPRTPDSPRLHSSMPIAIELPTIRKINTAPIYTPPEPLSARGDIPGGYFPLHEDPRLRVHQPHPFHPDAKHHHRKPFREVGRREPQSQRADRAAGSSLAMSEPSRYSPPEAPGAADGENHVPTASYGPIGNHDNPLPTGKYYPSNYEKRNPPNTDHLRPPVSARLSHKSKSDPQAPKHRLEASHPGMDSGAKHRLQQYQRDMIAQAALAASEVLGGIGNIGGSSLPSGMTLANMQFTSTTVRGQKPISPRLLPLGSPGPVTPIDLEGGGESYLTRGDAIATAGETGREKEAGLSVRVEEDRRRHEAVTPPVPSH